MICGGRACGKKLKGGFKQEDGTYRCAACVVNEVEMSVTLKSIENALNGLLPTLKTPKARFKKATVRPVVNQLRAILNCRNKPTAPFAEKVKEKDEVRDI